MWPPPSAECPVPSRQDLAPLTARAPPPEGGVRAHAGAAEGSPLIPVESRTLTAAATDVGRRRSGNEDSFELWAPEPGTGLFRADLGVAQGDEQGADDDDEQHDRGRGASHAEKRVEYRDKAGDHAVQRTDRGRDGDRFDTTLDVVVRLVLVAFDGDGEVASRSPAPRGKT